MNGRPTRALKTTVHSWELPRSVSAGLAVLSVFLLLAGCGTKEPPWVEYGPPRGEETLQAMAVALIMSIEDQWASPNPIHAICVGVGRRVQWGLRRAGRGDDWDPTGFFFQELGDPGLPVFPLSGCIWGDDVEERVEETGARAAALGVSHVNWTTRRTATISVWIRESPQYYHAYRCEFDRSGGDWEAVRCLFQFR